MTDRASIQSTEFAKTLYELLSPHIPDLDTFNKHISPPPTHQACNPNIRLYKYEPGQYFGAHYDDSIKVSIPFQSTLPEEPEVPPNQAGTSRKRKAVKPSSSQSKYQQMWSEWTVLVYISGEEDGVVGGQTVFYAEEGKGKGRRQREIIPSLTRGSVLLHRYAYHYHLSHTPTYSLQCL